VSLGAAVLVELWVGDPVGVACRVVVPQAVTSKARSASRMRMLFIVFAVRKHAASRGWRKHR
jgi:hypothetical protein